MYAHWEPWVSIAGAIGGLLSVGAFIPQAYRIWRRRSAVDISLAMYLSIVAASVLWMFYAYARGSRELFVTNLIIALISGVIIALRVRYSGRDG